MLDQLIELDKQLFLFFNSHHTPWLDTTMVLLSRTEFWIPLHVLILWKIVKVYQLKSIPILVAIGVTIVLSDQITTSLMKPFFERPRPSHEPSLDGLVHIVNEYRGGMYGFASSHAANTFGTALFLTLLFSGSKTWIPWLFVWAGLVSYTRIYLGVHYPGDIIAGALTGMLCAWLSFVAYRRIQTSLEKRKASPRSEEAS